MAKESQLSWSVSTLPSEVAHDVTGLAKPAYERVLFFAGGSGPVELPPRELPPIGHTEPPQFEAATQCPSCGLWDYHLIGEKRYVPTGDWRFGSWAVPDGPIPAAVWCDNLDLKPVVELQTRVERGILREVCAHLVRECLPCGHRWEQSLGWTRIEPEQACR